MHLRMVAAAAGNLLLTAALPAQRIVSSVDVSGTGVWYADSIRSAGSSLNPALRIDWGNGTLGAFGNVSRVAGGVSAQGMLTPSIFTPSVGPFSGELAASLGGSTHPDGTRTGQTLAFARAYMSRADAGAWVGGGLGRTWDGAVWRGVRQGEVGAWAQHAGLTSLLTVTPVSVADSIRYTDIQAALRYPTRTFELGMSLGTRAGSVGPAIGGTSRTWGSVSAVAWVSSIFSVVGSAGTYPVDLTQGYPGGRFVSISLRIASRDEHLSERAQTVQTTHTGSLTTIAEPASPSGVTNFEVLSSSGIRRTLRIDAPSAHLVEITGDFTQWDPVPLTHGTDGSWSAVFPISAGTHQLNVRVDGGAWRVPPGLLAATDEFGGAVGILTIE
jgi:hypothetical protein